MSTNEEKKKRDFEDAFFEDSSSLGPSKKISTNQNSNDSKSYNETENRNFVFKLSDNDIKLDADPSDTLKIEEFLKEPTNNETISIQPKSLSKFNMSTVSYPGLNFRSQPNSSFQHKILSQSLMNRVQQPYEHKKMTTLTKSIAPNPNLPKQPITLSTVPKSTITIPTTTTTTTTTSNSQTTKKPSKKSSEIDEDDDDSYFSVPISHPKPVKISEGNDLCTYIDITNFIKSLREGLTSGNTTRNYLQKSHHKIWIPVTLTSNSLKTGIYLTIDFIYNGTNVKSMVFPILTDSEDKIGAEVDFDLTTEKCKILICFNPLKIVFLQKRLYHIQFTCQDLRVLSPEFSIVNLQQFTKTKKRRSVNTTINLEGVFPEKVSSNGGEFIALYFKEIFSTLEHILIGNIEVKILHQGSNNSTHFPSARHMILVEVPPHPKSDVKIVISTSTDSAATNFTFY
eukprot:gene8281-106_t